jgi:four helix bundle protein
MAEGFARGGRREFRQFLATAEASCAEVRSQLYVAFDVGYLDRPGFPRLLAQAEEIGKIIGGLRVPMERPRSAQRIQS